MFHGIAFFWLLKQNLLTMNRARSIRDRIQSWLPDLIPHGPPRIRDYGSLPYFQSCRIGKRENATPNELNDTLNGQVVCTVETSLPRESIGARSQDIPLSNFQWLLNKRLTCVLMWFGVICLIVGVIALQIASFFKHKRQDILSTGVGCLSASFCLLAVPTFIFLHAYLIIYDVNDDETRVRPSTTVTKNSTTEGETLSSYRNGTEEIRMGSISVNNEIHQATNDSKN